MKEQLKSMLKDAMKARDQVRLDTIRSLISAMTYEEIEKKTEPLPETAALEICKRELKKRREELEFLEKSGRTGDIEKLNREIATIEEFLPRQMSEADLERIMSELRAADPAMNMGLLMKTLKERYPGQYDAKMASEIAKRIAG